MCVGRRACVVVIAAYLIAHSLAKTFKGTHTEAEEAVAGHSFIQSAVSLCGHRLPGISSMRMAWITL